MIIIDVDYDFCINGIIKSYFLFHFVRFFFYCRQLFSLILVKNKN